MRTFLLNMAVAAVLTLSSAALAGPHLAVGPGVDMRAVKADSPLVLVQNRSLRGTRSLRIRPRIRPRIRLRRFPAAGPSRTIRSGSGVLRDRYNRRVRTRGGGNIGSGGGRDIGAGQAVISAQSHVRGTVLGVRRNGSVYNVKILDRNRVRIIPVNAATGQIMR